MANEPKEGLTSKILSLIKNIIFLNGKVKQLDDIDLRLSVAETRLGSHLIGKDYWIQPNVGLNRQAKRKQIFGEIVKANPFTGIIETGTNLGFSTGYMANISSLPVITCEIIPMRYELSKQLLEPYFEKIKLFCANSVDFLKELTTSKKQELLFFYLDAHWYKHLPLREEIEIIGSTWSDSVIMIDDFKVENDPGYGYDDYGKVGVLDIDHIAHLTRKYEFDIFFPAFPSAEETGAKRGYVVLAKGKPAQELKKLTSLRPFKKA
jgi:predicted O-methyltransferase YrrM